MGAGGLVCWSVVESGLGVLPRRDGPNLVICSSVLQAQGVVYYYYRSFFSFPPASGFIISFKLRVWGG